MASGDSMGVLHAIRPNTDPAGRTWRTSADGSSKPIHTFDDSTIEYLDLHSRLVAGYAGGGLTLYGALMAESATSGAVEMEAAIRRGDTADDTDSSHSYSYQAATVTVSATNGARTYFSIAFANGAEMDNLSAGEGFTIRVRRNRASGNDTLVGDAQTILSEWDLRET